MPGDAYVGRDVSMTWGGQPIAKVQTKSLTNAAEAIDTTSDDDAGYATKHDEPAQRELSLSVAGLTVDNGTLQNDIGTKKTLVLTYPSGRVITGEFFMDSYTEEQSYKDAVKFTASLKSSGAFTDTEAS